MRNHQSSTNIFLLTTCSLVLSFFSCCNPGTPATTVEQPLFNDKVLTQELLTEYVTQTASLSPYTGKTSDEVRLYLDRSDGISSCFTSPVGGSIARDQLIEVNATYSGDNFKLYEVLEEVSPMTITGMISDYVLNAQNFEKIRSANLSKALNNITAHNGVSIFVTDGEYYDPNAPNGGKEFNNEPWAKISFQEWVDKGNDIYFFITDYDDKEMATKTNKTIKKHLYFMVFVPSSLKNDNRLVTLITKLQTKNPSNFLLTNTSWELNELPEEWTVKGTGINKKLSGTFNSKSYLRSNSVNNNSFEFIELNTPLNKEVFAGLKSPDDQIYKGLTVNLSNNAFYNINDVDIQVTDVTEDLNKFASYSEIVSNIPEVKTNDQTKKLELDPANPYTPYYQLMGDKPKPAEKYVWESAKKTPELRELFDFDKDLFSNSKQRDRAKVDLSFKLHKNFNSDNATIDNDLGYRLIRVEFVITDYDQKGFSESVTGYFKWISKYRYPEDNTGLFLSISEVILQSAAPRGKTIHSVFFKFF